MPKNNSFAIRKLSLSDSRSVSYAALSCLETQGFCSLSKLPFSIRVLLECALRNLDNERFSEEHLEAVLRWNPSAVSDVEVPFLPARVVLQDFTGVPVLVDLAALRHAVKARGGDAQRINPLLPCDMVIDHSLQVDFYGTPDALKPNEEREIERNRERYSFLKWGQSAFKNLRIVPPGQGIIHQVNLEYLSKSVFVDKDSGMAYPDSCVGTDSHTPMVNGLGVLAWGVGGIEAEAVLLQRPIGLLLPEVVGIKLTGELGPGVTATDLVLCVTELCRKIGVVGRFVEFFGPGLREMSVADRATVSNMAPEQGSTVSFFPVDEQVLSYLRLSGRGEEVVELSERYYKEQGLFLTEDCPVPEYSCLAELDLSNVEPALSGPKRPQDRILLVDMAFRSKKMLSAPLGAQGFGLNEQELEKSASLCIGKEEFELCHGDVVIAAITSCTNTSNPSLMLLAGLLAKNAVKRGLRVPSYVKTSLAPGSRVVTEYLKEAELLGAMEKLGFSVVGYGCTTCIGNSGPLRPEVEKAIRQGDIVAAAVLSGNRNFEGRVHPLTRMNFLASPPLVLAYALSGTVFRDLTKEPLGRGLDGTAVFLSDLWPSQEELERVMGKCLGPEHYREHYKEVFSGSSAWQQIQAPTSEEYQWDNASTYIKRPPFFDDLIETAGISPILKARVLGLFGDSLTTDHISPAGVIDSESPAAKYLRSKGVEEEDFNTYGSRRGNDEVMKRGTFGNIRLRNLLVPGKEGNITLHHPSGELMSFSEASVLYQSEGTPLVIVAGKNYGTGSSRDWAAKGPALLGIRVVIAESFERIHRSNLLGMGILPLQFREGQSAKSLGLRGDEILYIDIDDGLKPGQVLEVRTRRESGRETSFGVRCRLDTELEIEYYRNGGILQSVLKEFLSGGANEH